MSKMLEIIKNTFSARKKSNPFEKVVAISNSVFENEGVVIELENSNNPRFESFHGNKVVYLPRKYSNSDSLYVLLKDKFGEELFQKFIAYHEFGHASQVECNHINRPIHIKGESAGFDVNYLFNGSSVPNKINNFLSELFKEGFADCYAGLCLYKETDQVDVFKKISDVRSDRYSHLKSQNGKHFIHPNFNVHAAENMGRAIEFFSKNGKNIFDLPFTGAKKSIERYIERAVIAGCVAAVMTELHTNDAFLSHFRKFTREFNLSEHQVKEVLNSSAPIAQVMQSEKENGVASFFFELHTRLPETYKSVVPKDTLEKLLTDDVFKREVASHLELKDVVEIPYSAGLERAKSRMISLRESMLAPKNNPQAPKLK